MLENICLRSSKGGFSMENKPEKKHFRHTLYGKINISIKSLDKFIFCMFIFLVISIILGILF